MNLGGSLGDRLRRCRHARGEHVDDVGAAVGAGRKRRVHRQTVYRWEWGELSPSIDDLGRLALHFATSIDWLVTGRGAGPRYLRQKRGG